MGSAFEDQDDADSDSWGGQNVFDVYSKSEGTALDGTKYKLVNGATRWHETQREAAAESGGRLYADRVDDRDADYRHSGVDRHSQLSFLDQECKKAVPKKDLHVIRDAIDSYTMDKQKAPQSLDDLVQAGYLKSIPVDPMTHSNESWITNTDDTLESLDQTDPGINDVHSGSQEVGSDGQMYSTW